ncbi:uncharacterized protein LOC121177437 [Toxotes jaculatrix]|uniref:uncharacterized protein LOC121177437 n=1 Tax=Toxotes jaculatrix TaxID=941984 RepID=UPI001B3AE494|nr:uncharacterized protein LOC121177437 [Toxotes jaculatrix]
MNELSVTLSSAGQRTHYNLLNTDCHSVRTSQLGLILIPVLVPSPVPSLSLTVLHPGPVLRARLIQNLLDAQTWTIRTDLLLPVWTSSAEFSQDVDVAGDLRAAGPGPGRPCKTDLHRTPDRFIDRSCDGSVTLRCVLCSQSPGERGRSLRLVLQHQVDQTTPSAVTDVTRQKTSSSSSSSSSVSSESSQSSEGPQQVRERQNLENTAVEHMDSSQETSEILQSPSNSSTSLWLNELVSLGVESRERRHRVQLLTSHLMSRPQTRETSPTTEVGGTTTYRDGAIQTTGGDLGVEGGARGAEVDSESPRLLDDSREREDVPDHTHHHGYHRDEEGLELGL